MEHRSRTFFLLAALLIAGCGSRPEPVADAKQALAAGDRRLVGYMGVGLIVPGTPKGFPHWTYAPGVRVASNVTDTSSRQEIAKAANYATRYNQVILAGAGGAR